MIKKAKNPKSANDTNSDVNDGTIRQQQSRGRKKDVGQIPVPIYLDADTLELLDQLCQSQGYDLNKKGKRNIIRASVITYCIRKTCNKEDTDLETNPTNQAIRITSNIVKRLKLSKNPNTQQDYTDTELAELMSKSKFLRPGGILKKIKGSESKKWTEKMIRTISREKTVLKKMNEVIIELHREAAHSPSAPLPSSPEIPFVRRTSPQHIRAEAISKVYQIARYRREVCGDSDQQIATFMNKEGYPIPDDMVTSCSPIPHKGWKLENVEQIFNIDEQLDRVDS